MICDVIPVLVEHVFLDFPVVDPAECGLVPHDDTVAVRHRSGGIRHHWSDKSGHRGMSTGMTVHRACHEESTILWFRRASRCTSLDGVTD